MKFRYGVQGFFVLLFAYIGWRHQAVGGGPAGAPPLDAFCPFGGVETLPLYLTSGQFLAKTAPANVVALAAVLLVTLLGGAVFCGWFCPLGALGEWLYKLRLKIFRREIKLPAAAERVLPYGRYAVLGIIFYMTWKTSKLWFSDYDPFKQIFHMEVENAAGWVVIGLFAAGSLLVERAWCRFLCPLGGIVGMVSRFSLLKINRDDGACVHCRKCERVCPAGVRVESAAAVDDSRCISCYRCVESCPVAGTLTVKPRFGWRKAIRPALAAVIALLVLGGVIGAAHVGGGWVTKTPGGGKAVASLTIPDDIKGWMSWAEVVAVLRLDEDKLAAELKLGPGFDRAKSVKQLGQEYGFDTEALKAAAERCRK